MEAARDFRQFVPKGRMTVSMDSGRILAAAEDEVELRELGLDTVAGAMRLENGELMRDAGPRRTWRIDRPGGPLFVKVYSEVSLRERLRLFGRNESPARLEWDNIGQLRRAGFDMPEPVAVGEVQTVLGVPPQSFLVTRGVPGLPLDEFLADGWPQIPGSRPLAAREAVIRDVAGMIRRFHACGFFHRDLYCNHLIIAPDERWGRPYLIDLQRVAQQFPPRFRWRVKDLAALAYSAPGSVHRTDKLRFLLRYLGKSHLDPEARRWIDAIRRKVAQIASHAPKYG